ncbi:MAG: hypothetical protein KKD18_02515 [Nanoarchaeota archaeon]|nr:hypothetical protein [Nanoarchaeota archaeon]MBU0977264.1 hypothetical protein [Nanoarchaeota archaeon]
MEIEKDEPSAQEKLSKIDKQLYWIFGIMVLVIAIFLVRVYWAEDTGVIKYDGITFQKQMLGEIPLYQFAYSTNKIAMVSGRAVATSSKATVNMYLRNNPLDLRDIPVEGGKIEYLPVDKKIYIVLSASPDLLCDYGPIAMGQLSSFLNQNGFKMGVGISDEDKAKEQNMDYVTCEEYQDNMVLSFEAGSETKIIRNGNCYTLMVSDCRILPVAEKFIVQTLVDAKEEATSETIS